MKLRQLPLEVQHGFGAEISSITHSKTANFALPIPPITMRHSAQVAPALDDESGDPDDVLSSIPSNYTEFSKTPQRGVAAPLYEQQRQYKTRLCHFGDDCPYGPERCFFAHSEAEVRTPSARWWIREYKTRPCRYSWDECPFAADGRCQFAHSVEELKQAPPQHAAKYKTRMCKYAFSGTCRHAESCSYAHSAAELRTVPGAGAPPPLGAYAPTFCPPAAAPAPPRPAAPPRAAPLAPNWAPAYADEVYCYPAAVPVAAPARDDVEGDLVDKLERLTTLRDNGSICGDEFAALKKRLIEKP